MQPARVRAHYEHPISRWNIAAEIDDPWHSGGYFIYRLPEVFSFAESQYLFQPREAACWPGVQPEAAPEWSIDPYEKKTGYNIKFYDGLELGVEVRAGTDLVDFKYTIANNTERPGIPSTENCLMLWTSPPFIDRRHDRTFVWIKGKPIPLRKLTPTPEELKRSSWVYMGVKKPVQKPYEKGSSSWWVNEAADHGLIAVKSSTDNSWLGLAWAKAKTIMARSSIPCLHSEPTYLQILPGKKTSATGRIYFHEGPLKDLENRFRSDEEDETLRVETQ